MDVKIDITEDNNVSLDLGIGDAFPVLVFTPKNAITIGAGLLRVAHQADPTIIKAEEEGIF